jgi:hypothetical protein
MLIDCRRRVRAFDVLYLGTAISKPLYVSKITNIPICVKVEKQGKKQKYRTESLLILTKSGASSRNCDSTGIFRNGGLNIVKA